MKYTRKTPYFKKGKKVKKRVEVGDTGKTKEEIMAEARRNQAIEKKAQATDAEKAKTANNVSKPKKDLSGTSSKAKPYSGNISKPNKYLSGTNSKAKTASIVALPTKARVTASKPSTTQSTVDKSDSASKSAEINRLNDLNTASASKNVQVTTPVEIGSSEYKNYPRFNVIKLQQQPNESVSADNVVTNTTNTPQLTVDGNTTTYREDNPYTGPKYYRREFVTDNTGAQVPTYFSGTDLENLKRIRNYALVNRGPYYRVQQIFDKIDRRELKKQGGTINKFQRGTQGSGITRADLPKTSKWNIFGFQPNSAKWFPTDRDLPKGQTEEVSRYMHRNKDITTLRRPRPYYTADQPSMYNSTRTINWDNNTPVDTIYTYGNKVIQPNTIDYERYKAAFAGGDRALLQNIGKHQQGGEVQQQPQMTEEDLIMDFTVRYLSALGVAPEEIMDQEGNLNPTYVEEITNVFQQGDIDWESYMASPDEYIQQFVGSRMQMARKGAKLKRLSQLRIYKK